MLTMIKMVKKPDEEFMHETPITLSKRLEEPKVEINGRNSNNIKDQGKQKDNQFHGDNEE